MTTLKDPSITPSTFSTTRFDYLIVGGGTAGLVVAARLSEARGSSITVGVLEAGPKSLDDPLINVPGRFGESLGGQYDWRFETVPQPGLNGRRLLWPRGRVLGGTSALNFMTWTRGNREDYDAWEELGNEGWGWDGMLPFFKRTETLHQSSPKHQSQHQSHFNTEFHGTDGPISSIYSKDFSAPHQHWHATLNNLGLETNKSHFSGSNLGAFTTLTSVDPDTRTRASSATAYYLPNLGRSNLHVLPDATVHRVLLEGRDDEWVATGVAYACGGQEFVVRAAREVILCAGSVQSPQVLELSGIGNPEILEAAGISVKVANSNVGENLQEHMRNNQLSVTAAIYELPSDLIGPDELRADSVLAAAAQEAYKTSQSGVYAMLPCALGYASLSQVIPSPKLRWILSNLPTAETSRDKILSKQFTNSKRGQIEYLFDLGNWSPYFKSEPGRVYGTMLMMLQLPLSKGSIHITSSSINDKPAIDPKYFEGPGGELDFSIMSYCQRFADKICRTSPLSSIIQKRVYPPESFFPSPSEYKEDFTSWIRSSCITDWHPIGTCAMGGHEGIKAGVVDARLRVYGVKRLRVADASVMPLHICSHPQATVYAIGEKAAEMILNDWGS
ncbi:putative choline dehydrogenase [Lindgomyces ingoldianus]|uniref:Choline dehydrogenase n=1 Tax=Lindgomyces ingoldianus TaxID=673940 RepID=A0ACB6QH20_9PLEO|nr:putative choline dehydrogenase [Lindgomyces ingoldianus]KAF2466181.1 putative choline dehydrogenase [Lindgomyces ingoldianus]